MSNTSLRGRDFITWLEFTRDEMDAMLDCAHDLKRKQIRREPHKLLDGLTLHMLFYNTSLRTRNSFETAMTQLGGHAQFINPQTMRLSLEDKPGAGETVKDTAEAMERYCDGIGIRLLDDAVQYYGHGDLVMRTFAKHCRVPIINMASDINHPCQSLTDIYTMQEKLGDVRKKKIVIMWAWSPWIRGWCSVQGTALISSMYGMDVVLAHPPEYALDPKVMDDCRRLALTSGGSFQISHNLDKALDGATVVFPRNWFTQDRYTIGKEKEAEIAKRYSDWTYSAERQRKLCAPGHLLQCMPVDRGNEADPEVCDNALSWILDQAENRLHTQKAILTLTMGGRL